MSHARDLTHSRGPYLRDPCVNRKPVALAAADGSENRILLSVGEVAGLLGIGTTLAYELVGRGVLPHVRLGRRVLVPRALLEEWIAESTRGRPARQQEPDSERFPR